jgi:hypothetical protein
VEIEKKKYWLLLYGLVTGIVFDILFYNKTLGISYPVFILLILSITALVFWNKYDVLDNRGWLWAIPIIFLSSTFAIFSNQVLKILNSIIIPFLLVMLIILVSRTNRSDWADLRFLGDFFKRVFLPIRYIHMPFITFFRMTDTDGRTNKRIFPRIAMGILISVPILAIIIWLLSSADIIFKDLFVSVPISRIIKHFFLVLAITIYAACFYWSIVRAQDEDKNPSYDPVNWKRSLDPIVLLTILFLLDLVYAVFSFIQFTYLFGGESFVLPSSYTFAEYARRGFFELLAVAVINFVIILITVSFIRRENSKLHIANKVLMSFMVCFTFVMLASAFYRMLVYEQAYGFTYLRIFVQAFMVLLVFLFMINIVFIWYSRLPIIKAYFIASLSVYIALNFANVDVIIAQNNIERYAETGEIDMEYLKGLSYDAIPQMARLAGDKELGDEVLKYFGDKKQELEDQDCWQSFNHSRSKAGGIIDKTSRAYP